MKTPISIEILIRASLGLFAVLAASSVSAQGSPTFGPEVTAILGEPDGPQTNLDADVLAVLGRPDGAAPNEATINARSKAIDLKLRCPVCQGVAIADSPSGMATNMRAQVRDLVAKGYSEEQVMTYFERSYGELVRLEPPLRGLNWMLWILPGLVLAGGVFFVFRMARPKASPAVAAGTRPPPSAVDPDLARYLERIRRDSGTSS